MKAMILAAGLGTRLRPLTNDRPKALVEVAGRTLLEITLLRLHKFGVRQVIVNVHHFPDMVIDYLKANQNFGMHIEISREDVLLDTGGGLKKAAPFFLENSSRADEPFILHNVDVLTTIDLGQMAQFHSERQALATLAVQNRQTSRYLLFDEHLQLCGRRTIARVEASAPVGTVAPAGTGDSPVQPRSGASAPQALAFSGIHVISPRLLSLLTEEGAFSIIDSYLRLATQGEKILAFRADTYYWRDLGRPENVTQAIQDFESKLSC